MLDECKFGTERGRFAPEFGAKSYLSGLQIRLCRDVLVDWIKDLRSDMLCCVAGDTAFFEGMRQGKSISHTILLNHRLGPRIEKVQPFRV